MIRLFVGIVFLILAALGTGATFATYRLGSTQDRDRTRFLTPVISISAAAGAWLVLNGLDTITSA